MKKINVLINCKWTLINIKELIQRLRENQAVGTIYIVLNYENAIFNKDIMIYDNAVNLFKCKELFPNCEFIMYRNAYIIDALELSALSKIDKEIGFLSTLPISETYDFNIDSLNHVDSVGAFAADNRYWNKFNFTTRAVEHGIDIYSYFINLFKTYNVDIVYSATQNHYLADYMVEKAAIDSNSVAKVVQRRALGFGDAGMKRFCLVDSKSDTIVESLRSFNEYNNQELSMYRDAGQINLSGPRLSEIFSKMTVGEFCRVVKFELYKRLYFFPFYLKGIKGFYDKLCTIPNEIDKYIFIPLHFEPESTISPLDGINSLQLYNIKILRSVLPEGWKIYVKEHPTQFKEKAYNLDSYTKSLPQYKNKRFYEYISNMSNVHLIKTEVSQKELIENSQIVASNSGSVFMEASSSNKPCLAFGKNAFASMFSNVWSVSDVRSCKKAVKEILNIDNISSNYMEIIEKYSMQSPREMCFAEPVVQLLKELSVKA
ncbi:hypothetical protein [Francisella sp. 19X1-34]|uniref:hypothetical protein n=1 Tax=Francisella sp. 19X1-34 TaxID=3087177 RepID=UPI002E33C17F|nr:hypothetical protein [Francisella sp. 19X1-34]MED7787529.1 hypothetical protein [Francisella sp. 19X1-34]